MARKDVPIHVIVYYPKTEEGKSQLAKSVADIHADVINRHIQKLHCPTVQKEALLDAVLESVKKSLVRV